GRLKPLGRSLGELFDAYLEAEKVPAALRAQGSKAIEGLFDLNTAAVHTVGGLSEFPSEPLLAAGYRFFGWQMLELNGDPKPALSVFDGLTAALGGRDLARILTQHAQIDEKAWPKFSTHALTLRGFKPGAKAYRVDLPRALFEKLAAKPNVNLQDFSAALSAPSAKGKAVAKSVPLSFVVASDGEHTFIAVSPDEKALVKRLESLKDPKLVTLRTREGLDELKSTPRSGGGFLTLRRFANQLGLAAGDSANLLNALPQHGDTPIPFHIDSTADGPDCVITLTVPRAAIGDLGTLAPVLALAAGKNASLAAP
ncbi:MAG TPA: hypothetical protein VGM29_11115, partial [Polyangiaceae bacterium]